ncbi:hypothetical protein I302_103910 [Kwoniella bestiolae CBS 10118]|uniref:G domain-containing protein n=1 Tax=Kwoniella bestiolae CBS 10118 TaxID=1296100 RepID=A0A1B9G9S8_9TREE|nr:hypothetical protein I302_02615 [Kwoniella bestiolae CBS 10118]OCF27769.1 hypothetical protein I302_02615 [Kwoniella bestiolae CBS 10118]
MSFIRPAFPYPARIPSWFAGHMSRSLRELPTLLENIDLVIEARDSRLPLTSINSTFDQMLGKAKRSGKGKGKEKEKLVVYTKRDLGERRYEEPLKKAFLQHAGQKVMFADTRSDQDVREVLRHAVRIARENQETIPDLRVLVVGMPNVGKSSLLNALRRVGLRKGKAFRTGAEAGITRKLTGTVRIYDDPSVYVYDTPGVMVPYLGRGEDGAEKGLKLALTAGIKESLFEQDAMVDYLLWKMNKRLIAESHLDDTDPNKHQTYLSLLPLPAGFQPTDDISHLLDALSDRLGALKKGGERDHEAASGFLIRAFREGKLGEFTLDDLTPGQPKKHISSTSEVADEGQVQAQAEAEAEAEAGPQDQSSKSSEVDETQIQIQSVSLSPSTTNSDLDIQVSQTVKQYLSLLHPSSSSSSQPNSFTGISQNQQKKANKRQRLEERDTKLRAKGVNVPIRQWGDKRSLRRGSRVGEAGRMARSRR